MLHGEKEVLQVIAVKAIYDGNAFIPVEPVRVKRNQPAIVTILDDEIKNDKPHKRFIGSLSQESYEEISKALLDTQKVDVNEW